MCCQAMGATCASCATPARSPAAWRCSNTRHLKDYEPLRCGMARIVYARVSSVGQSLEMQLAKLADCDKIYREKRSGAVGKRPQLDACLEYVREGDTLVVARLDRPVREFSAKTISAWHATE